MFSWTLLSACFFFTKMIFISVENAVVMETFLPCSSLNIDLLQVLRNTMYLLAEWKGRPGKYLASKAGLRAS